MIAFDEAYNICMQAASIRDAEKVGLHQSLGRILAEDIFADADHPAFDRSAMDGFAVRYADLLQPLEIIEVIAAGCVPTKSIAAGQCAKIMTGAMLPQGADTVVMVEDCSFLPNGKMQYKNGLPLDACQLEKIAHSNIRYRGEDFIAQENLIEKGSLIGSTQIAIMASVGVAHPLVYKQSNIGIIVTGSELVEVHQQAQTGQIRNSNGPQILAQVHKLGFPANYYGIAPDTREATLELILRAKRENDILLLSGGVSKGDYDYVPEMLQKAGFQILFREIAVQPGKPTLFGKDKEQYCFGLPGNPVSSFIQFELLVKPFLFQLSGAHTNPFNVKMPLGESFSRSKAKRESWIPVRIEAGKIWKVHYNGSAHIHALTFADGFIAFPVGVLHMENGELVNIRTIE